MAEIYKAKVFGVGGFEKDLVVKQILPQYAKFREFVDMFIDEAKITVSLNHGNIVPVYELGRIEGIYFIAMEYIHGRDLSQCMLRAAELEEHFSPEQAVAVIIDVLRGLDYAHRRKDRRGEPMGIVHRDVSPQNVMVSFDGEVKILDFGIAKATQRLVATHPGAVRGKFGYLSPEQAAGEHVDRRADIFAAGTVLWELLTRRRLFGTGSEAEALDKIRKAVVEPPSSVNPEVPDALDEIVLQALQKAPQARYKDAGAFQLALSKYLYTSGSATTSESIGDYMKQVFAEHLEDEQAEDDDPKHLELVRSLEQELAEKLRAHTTDPGRRPRRRTRQGRAPHPTEPGLGQVSDRRTPTRPRHIKPPSGVTPMPGRSPHRPGSSSRSSTISGTLGHGGATPRLDTPVTSDSLSDQASLDEAMAKAADPNYDLDAFLTEVTPGPGDESGPGGDGMSGGSELARADGIHIDSRSAAQYEVFASREADLEEAIFSSGARSSRTLWILPVALLLLFGLWLFATQTSLLEEKKPSPPRSTTSQPYTGNVVIRVQPRLDHSEAVPVPYRIYWHQGATPATVTDLPMGQRHLLLLELAGYRPLWVKIPPNAWRPRPNHQGPDNAWERKVWLRMDEATGAAAQLVPLKALPGAVPPPPTHTGRLLVDTEPPGAQIWLLAGNELKAQNLDPTKLYRFMGLSRLGHGRKVLTIRPFKSRDEPGDWRAPPGGGLTLTYEGILQMVK